jgi:hypothetical protein
MKVKEEQDGDDGGGEGWLSSRVDGSDGVDSMAAHRRGRHRRGHGKFWHPDGVQVKILWLGFKDRAAGGFIGGPL